MESNLKHNVIQLFKYITGLIKSNQLTDVYDIVDYSNNQHSNDIDSTFNHIHTDA